ncbi:MAG: DUF169 domain-containing protein [Peptococcaceae bacterium]|jgi:uncharacterized protein (DUF169 family)|nr:DUF169 domain-containing protein [Peptococcaceae bacterium]
MGGLADGQTVKRVNKALGLKNPVIGVRFLYFQEEYEANPAPAWNGKLTVCGMAKRALDGHIFKVAPENFGCPFGSYAVGVGQPDLMDRNGQTVERCLLYEDYGVARQIMEGMCFLTHDVYGLLWGPLEELAKADVAIIVGSAYQMMRVMQGYAYKMGNPRHLCSVGNQAVCSDLIAKPFTRHDINISFMCKGARINMRCDDGEMAAAIPVGLFGALAEGILLTLNPVLDTKQKTDLLARLETPDELGFPIDTSWTYSTKLREFLAEKEQALAARARRQAATGVGERIGGGERTGADERTGAGKRIDGEERTGGGAPVAVAEGGPAGLSGGENAVPRQDA